MTKKPDPQGAFFRYIKIVLSVFIHLLVLVISLIWSSFLYLVVSFSDAPGGAPISKDDWISFVIVSGISSIIIGLTGALVIWFLTHSRRWVIVCAITTFLVSGLGLSFYLSICCVKLL